MEQKQNILAELTQISQAVATIGNRNVYTVPAGYFDNLAEEVLAKVQLAPLQALPMPFSVPAGYFDSLAGNIMDKIRAQEQAVPQSAVFEELQQLAPLFNTYGKKVPYSVPEGYFDNLAGNIIDKIKAQEQPVQHSEVFEELAQLSPLLNSISRQMPYSVPEGYFQQFSVNITVQAPQQAKVVSIKSSRPKWVMYLAAACVTAVLGIGGYLFIQRNNVTPPVTASVNPADVDKALSGLSDDDINNYLDNQASNSPDVIPVPADDQGPDVQPTIENMSTEEIQQYLKENSGPDEKRTKDI